jgi:beta-lactamase regulating signal transducer with metallopeptidase domain
VDALLRLGLENALAATLLALVAALSTRLGRPALAHAFWLLVLLKLVTPPLYPLYLPRPEQVHPAPAAAVEVLPAGEETPAPPLLLADGPAVDVLPEAAPDWRLPVGVCWLSGSVLWWVVACRRLRRFGRLLHSARPAAPEVVERMRRLAGRMGLRRCPSVWFLSAPVSPLLLALGRRPRLLLPAALWPRLSEEQQETLLAHELAHLRRRDHWVRRLELVVLGLYWWHPVAWWARRQLQEAEEQCCDAWVAAVLPESAPAYAAALIETVSFLSRAPLALPIAASGVGPVPQLKRRLTMILQGKTPPRLSWWGALAVLVGAALLPLLPTWADPPQPPAADRSAEAKAPPADNHNEMILRLHGLQQTCTACHVGQAHVAPIPAGKWEHLHDEAVKLANLLAAARPEKDRAEQIQAVRDEVEVLQAELEVKQAQLPVAEARVLAAKAGMEEARAIMTQHQAAVDRWDSEVKRLKREVEVGVVDSAVLHESVNKLKESTAAREAAKATIDKAKAEVLNAEAALGIAKAVLRVAAIKLRQAQRRLAALEGPPPDARKRQQAEERLKALDLQLRKLLEEKKTLEQELHKDK